MGLDDLVARIELLQARIRSHKAALRENETRTRMALIDPLMHALGWDVSELDINSESAGRRSEVRDGPWGADPLALKALDSTGAHTTRTWVKKKDMGTALIQLATRGSSGSGT